MPSNLKFRNSVKPFFILLCEITDFFFDKSIIPFTEDFCREDKPLGRFLYQYIFNKILTIISIWMPQLKNLLVPDYVEGYTM